MPKVLSSKLADQADEESLDALWRALPDQPDYTLVREPEVGTVMVRARADGVGAPYSFAEITVTRCAAQVTGGFCGLSYITGRRARHAELAAVVDALLQDEQGRQRYGAALLTPLAQSIDRRRQATRRRAGASRVDFLTLVRENDGQ